MADFISEIKRINTDGLIYWFSQQSIEMFKTQESLKQIEIPVIRYGRPQRLCVQLSAWDIPDIDYLSVKFSNDYRSSKKRCPPNQLVNLYRDYDNEANSPEIIKNMELEQDGLFRVILGMTAEQFQYNNMAWIFERFNRNYYILLAAPNFAHRFEIDVNNLINQIFGCTADDYIAILLMVFWLCSQSPLPLTAPPHLYQRKEVTILTEENLTKFIAYYTCSYAELRTSPLKKQLLYAKPFIKTDRTKSVMLSSMFLVAMLVGNGLYWLIRDYYREKGQTFVNAFGRLFEDYIFDLATTYCTPSEWTRLKEGKKKEADFLFTFNGVQILVEAKTSLLGLEGKQQVPDSGTINKFFQNTIQKAYQQLTSSYEQLKRKSNIDTPILKIILLYDEFSNTAILEQSIEEIFLHDPTCYIITIRELEILLHAHKHYVPQFEAVLTALAYPKEEGIHRKTVSAVLDDFSLRQNHHFEGEMDFFQKLMDHFGTQLK